MGPEVRRLTGYSPWEEPIGFSRAVVLPADARLVLVSGLTAAGPGGVLHPGDARAQLAAAVATGGRVLTDAGTGLDWVVRTRMYVVGAEHCAAVGRAHHDAFGAVRPAATMVVVAGLIDPAMLVEIELEALLP